MREETRHFETELAIVGSGIAGFAASIFALNRKIDTAQVGNTGAVAYTTGYLDLLGAIEQESVALDNPWHGIERLKKLHPDHPLCRTSTEDIRNGFEQFTAFLGECGIAYTSPQEDNITALTPCRHPEENPLRPRHHGCRSKSICRQSPLCDYRF